MRLAFKTAFTCCHPIFLPALRRTFHTRNLPTKTLTLGFGFYPCRAIMAVPSRPPVQVRDNVQLNETEQKIFDRLLGTLRRFGLQNQLRVAGGWVRDKLLGKECYAIDISLDNMLGSEFVDKVQDYVLHVGEEAQGIAVIPCNPDQSKHLETARMHIRDRWIDFVNLRCEEYCENSRIPTVHKYGTPEEDAYRRDLTINSLFYNLNTSSIEDYTKRGIEDLTSGVIVTPLPSKATFMDDLLRVLRAICFGARFGFILDEELKEAAACDEVKAALSVKITRERIGTEIDLMISGNQPVQALAYISDLKLFWVVFSLHTKHEPEVSEGWDRLCVSYLVATWNLIQLIGLSNFTDKQRRLSLYAAMFLPLRKTMYKDNRGKKVWFPWFDSMVNYIFRDSLKRKASDAETVVNVHFAMEKFLFLIPYFASNEDARVSDVNWARESVDAPLTSKPWVLTGFLLREIKDFWRVALLMSTLLYPPNIDCTEDLLSKNFELERRRSLFKAAEDAILKLGYLILLVQTSAVAKGFNLKTTLRLAKVWDVKPLLNGKEIMNVLQLKTGGPLVREWQQKILAWQHARPSGTAEECLNWMWKTHCLKMID